MRSASVRIEGNTMVSLDSYLETEWKENPESLIVEIIYHKQHSIQQPEVVKHNEKTHKDTKKISKLLKHTYRKNYRMTMMKVMVVISNEPLCSLKLTN